MWLLAKTLPLLIGHFVPVEDKHWECYCLLLRTSLSFQNSLPSSYDYSQNAFHRPLSKTNKEIWPCNSFMDASI